MAIISEKYLAGLLDSDGGISWQRVKKGVKPRVMLSITQRLDKADVLYQIKETFGGQVTIRNREGDRYNYPVAVWYVVGNNATNILRRVLQHCVIKRDYFEWSCKMTEQRLEMESIEFNALRKQKRKARCSVEKNFPSRKWLAGYFDGDGCITVSNVNKDGTAIIRFGITCHKDDAVGIELIRKNFGGTFTETSVGRTCWQWTLYMSNRNLQQGMNFLDHFANHAEIKQSQILAVRQYLNSAHKDGAKLDSTLRQLKQPPAETK